MIFSLLMKMEIDALPEEGVSLSHLVFLSVPDLNLGLIIAQETFTLRLVMRIWLHLLLSLVYILVLLKLFLPN